jgi:intracellular sulfur oxidation DsrE/DsrF family protein
LDDTPRQKANERLGIVNKAQLARFDVDGYFRGEPPTGEPAMKRVLVVCLALLTAGFAYRAPQPYRVAFDLTSRDTLDQRAVLRWIREVTSANPSAEIEVVMYGKGFELVMPERSAFANDVRQAMANPKVQFKVCAISLRNNNVAKTQLLAGVETVPDAIQELVSKQQENWGYIKVAH